MADFEVKENPSFSDTMRKLEITDEAHADLFNKQFKTLLDNDNYLKKNVSVVKKELSSGTEAKVSEHNASEAAHADIRELITTLATRLNALADSDDTTLDQLSEIVAYIKSNRSLIENITTKKVNVDDIIDNLTSSAANKPLAAKQGKVLKDLIDTLTSIVDGKVNKAGDEMIGDLIVPVTRPNTSNSTLPACGSLILPDLMNLRDYRGFLGTYAPDGNSNWHYIISVRHRNGFGDGNLYGMYIKAPLSSDDKNLTWGYQNIEELSKERTILDSSNYKKYCTPENIGLGNVNNTPDYLKHVEAAAYLTGWADTRNVETKPSDYSEKFKPVGLKTPAASKITTGSSFATLVGIRGWSDTSAGKAHELAFDGNGKLLHRVGVSSWEDWREIAHIDDILPLIAENALSKVLVEGSTYRLSLLSAMEGASGCGIEAYTKSNGKISRIRFYNGNTFCDSQDKFSIRFAPSVSSPDGMLSNEYIFDNTALYPFLPIDLGMISFKWRNIYATNGTIQTSDRTKKKNVKNLNMQKMKLFVNGLIPCSYEMVDGTSGRTHYGLIAQDIEKLMKKLGMTSKDFAGFIKSPKKVIKYEEYEDKNGNKFRKPIEQVIEGEYEYGLRYEELIAPIICVEQELLKTVEQQQKTIDKQQEMINKQQKEIEELKREMEKLKEMVLKIV